MKTGQEPCLLQKQKVLSIPSAVQGPPEQCHPELVRDAGSWAPPPPPRQGENAGDNLEDRETSLCDIIMRTMCH